MPPKATKKATADVEALLSSLDDLSTSASPAPPAEASASASASGAGGDTPTGGKAAGDAQSLLDDLDDLVQRRAATPRRTASSAVPAPAAASASTDAAAQAASSSTPSPPSSDAATAAQAQESAQTQAGGGGWGWSSAWSSAAKLADQARAEIERRTRESEQARELQARTWGIAQGVRGFVKDAGLEKFGEWRARVRCRVDGSTREMRGSRALIECGELRPASNRSMLQSRLKCKPLRN